MQERCLSVVVPVFNEENTLATIVDKLLALPQLLEIVIVDDCSTDKTPEILRRLSVKHKEIQAVRHERNSGKTEALKTGFSPYARRLCDCSGCRSRVRPGRYPQRDCSHS